MREMAKKDVGIIDIVVYKFYSLLGLSCRTLFFALTPKKIVPKKELADFHVLYFCGKKGLKLLKASIMSIYLTWDRIPHITVVTDGTPTSLIEQELQFWPYPITVKCWDESVTYLLSMGRDKLVEWSYRNVFARKLQSILVEAETRPTLYCDTDILWFGEPRIPQTTNNFVMRISEDNVPTYSETLISQLDRWDIMTKKPMNAGLIFLSGSPYQSYDGFAPLIDLASTHEEGPSEQLVFSLIAERLGDCWTLDEVIVDTTDLHWPLIPPYFFSGHAFARHHVLTKRSWFWRDALFLYFFRRKFVRKSVARINTDAKEPSI
jgi:hypothetical protein